MLMSSSAPHLQTPSAYVPSSMWQTKFHTHTKQWSKLQLLTKHTYTNLFIMYVYTVNPAAGYRDTKQSVIKLKSKQ
jgi:hypothetical protein